MYCADPGRKGYTQGRGYRAATAAGAFGQHFHAQGGTVGCPGWSWGLLPAEDFLLHDSVTPWQEFLWAGARGETCSPSWDHSSVDTATCKAPAFWDHVRWVFPPLTSSGWAPAPPFQHPFIAFRLTLRWGGKRNWREVSSKVSAAHPALSSHWAHKLVLTPPGKNNKYKRRTWLSLGSRAITGAATAEQSLARQQIQPSSSACSAQVWSQPLAASWPSPRRWRKLNF